MGLQPYLILAAVADMGAVIQAGWAATAVSDEIVGEAKAALAAAQAEAPKAEAVFLEGSPGDLLLRTASEKQVDLLAVGTHGGSRAGGIVFGSVATLLLHKAPCSVLAARASDEPERFPKSICIGVDGSAGSAAAARVGYELAAAFGAGVSAVAACGGTKLELGASTAKKHAPAKPAAAPRMHAATVAPSSASTSSPRHHASAKPASVVP